MKAILVHKYGPTDSLKLEEVNKPVPGEKEVLVKVSATAVNDYDWSLVRGKPGLYRLLFGLWKPKNKIPGMELSGLVESVGSLADNFKPGDRVFGDISQYGFGSFAEYCKIHQDALRRMPDSMSFEEAVTFPHASLLALQGLQKAGELKPDSKILINGAGGGVGGFVLQMVKQQSGEVTGVDTGDKLKKMLQDGFDQVIDYKKEDFTKSGKQYDLIFDCKTTRSPFAISKALKPGGVYITIGGNISTLLLHLFTGKIVEIFSRKKMKILGLKPNNGLEEINRLYELGMIKGLIDGPYPLEETPQRIQYFGEGMHYGKVVLTTESGNYRAPL